MSYIVPAPSPLGNEAPTLRLAVLARALSDRIILAHPVGAHLIIQAPPAAQAHLLYTDDVICDNFAGPGGSDGGRYSVGAPGYVFAFGRTT